MPAKTRNVALTLAGVAGLLLKSKFTGQPFIHSYMGNFTVSFAVYFILANHPLHLRYGRLATAGLALAVVELFEATDGFGLMSNTYDPADYLANAAGVALALLIDRVWGTTQLLHTTS